MPPKDPRVRLRHMILAGTKAQALVQVRTRAQFEADETLVLALTRHTLGLLNREVSRSYVLTDEGWAVVKMGRLKA